MDSCLKKRKIKKEIEAKKNKATKHYNEEESKEEEDGINVNECEEGLQSPPITFNNKFSNKNK